MGPHLAAREMGKRGLQVVEGLAARLGAWSFKEQAENGYRRDSGRHSLQ